MGIAEKAANKAEQESLTKQEADFKKEEVNSRAAEEAVAQAAAEQADEEFAEAKRKVREASRATESLKAAHKSSQDSEQAAKSTHDKLSRVVSDKMATFKAALEDQEKVAASSQAALMKHLTKHN